MVFTNQQECTQLPQIQLTQVFISSKQSQQSDKVDAVCEQNTNNKVHKTENQIQKNENMGQNIQKDIQKPQENPLKQTNAKVDQSEQQSTNNRDMNEGSTDSENKVLFIQRNWCEEKDTIETEYSDSLSYCNVLASVSLWIFLFLQIVNAVEGWYGWFIVAFFYIIYLIECYHCSIFTGILKRKATIGGLNQFINQLVLQQPQITYQINKYQKSNCSNNSKPAQEDIEQQGSNKQNNSQEEKCEEKKGSKKEKMSFEKNTISFEFDKMKNECLNLTGILKCYNKFKLQVDVVSQIEDENSIICWNEKKQQFKDQHKDDLNCQILSSVEYTKQEGELKTYYMNKESKFSYYSTFFLFSLFSLIGLSLFFRFAFNNFFPTIRVKLVKHLSN